ncbi:MAG: hypothetical protein Fur0041_02140 [Bacteroidia bacterium]
MDKYNINRNKKPLTDEDIAKGKDFNAFMKSYAAKKKPFYKTKTFYMSVAVTGAVIAVGSYLLLKGPDTPAETDKPFISPAFAGVNISDTTYSINADSSGYFYYNTGSIIQVPNGAFLDSAGNPVKGNVDIRYREFHDPAAIFIAGIPMTYDSAGQTYHFESAGMLEITAWQNGHPLKANPDHPVRVAMASNTSEEKFNVYYLDTLKKNWSFIKKDDAAIIRIENAEDSADAKVKVTVAEPLKPVKADSKKPSFAISFDPMEFPELTAYKGIRFEVDEKKTPYNKSDSKVKWEDVVIERNKDNKTYNITFTLGERSVTYTTYAVVDEKNYKSAMMNWEKNYADYQAARNSKIQKEEQAAEKQRVQMEARDRNRIFVNDTLAARSARLRLALNLNDIAEGIVLREFVISNFGVWNSDCPTNLPDGAQIFARMLDSRTKKPMTVSHVYLVEKGRNAIFTYYTNGVFDLRFNPDADNMMWAITTDGFLAKVSVDDFKNIDRKKKECDIVMQVTTAKIKTPAEARAALDFKEEFGM